ncbi:MAG TPA: cytochrome o ubiquinol oxidase subunit III [Candidatus Saccharimonadales bacterium]|nr:cytochrome o ubiquinol oxidase subunit III [Candidatus Saccharimonadales bacterium]
MSEAELAIDAKVTRQTERQEADNKTFFGFWVYLMTDCVLFASLFATFAVLHSNTFGGPSAHSLFSMPYALSETLVLLVSSFTCGLAILSAQNKAKRLVLFWLGVTFLLGAAFLTLEIREFSSFVHNGDSWRRSGFLSSYFTLVATHGLHITMGLIWILTMIFQVIKRGLGRITVRQLTLMSLFWHFLDLIWIFIFSIVYLISGGLNI